MSVKPILFNTNMVRAILDGRKTVTRRIIKPRYRDDEYGIQIVTNLGTGEQYIEKTDEEEGGFDSPRYVMPPYQPGDILYVRESIWQKVGHFLDVDGETKHVFCNEFRYVATDGKLEDEWNRIWVKRPSIHMPKEAARIWLKVTDVRVEQLQDITEEQAQAEGCTSGMLTGPCAARQQFEEIWNSTVKKSDTERYGWKANPWVWVIEFEQCEKPEGWCKDGRSDN